MTIRCIVNSPAAARAVSKMAATSSSRVRPACIQSLSYHSNTPVNANNNSPLSSASSLRRTDSFSSIRDLDADPQNWGGYRVLVAPSNNNNASSSSSSGHRSYATSSISAASIGEDYDDYTLYGGPSDCVQCDLGAIAGAAGEELDAILHFDEAGFVRPIWETIGAEMSNASNMALNSMEQESDEWTMHSHNDTQSHESSAAKEQHQI